MKKSNYFTDKYVKVLEHLFKDFKHVTIDVHDNGVIITTPDWKTKKERLRRITDK